MARTFAAALLALAASVAFSPPPRAADPAKTLRVVFSIAETSFDPQFASDAASDGVISNIYEAMLDYDYLARPVKLVPRTLEAMPDRSRWRQDLSFQDSQRDLLYARPRFQGQAARADRGRPGLRPQTAAGPGDQEPVGVVDRRQGAGRGGRAREGREDRQARLRRPDRRARSGRPLHAADPAEGAGPALPVRARRAEHVRRRPRSRRGLRARFRRASRRHRALHAGRVQAQLQDRAGRESRLSRSHLHARPGRSRPSRRRSRRRSRASACRSRRASRST